ncbi:MAG: zinc-binding alcohol dehydrogenase [Phycisphaeraceae bacterium]|nr:zinc-binding alcohol dehydrogenase [Phycisphaeraceae bacterium]
MSPPIQIFMPEAGRIEQRELRLPDPGEEQVQVQIDRTVISPGTERALLTGLCEPWAPLPFPLGYSGTGTVVKVGPGVESFREGDRVAGEMPHASRANVKIGRAVKVGGSTGSDSAAFIKLGVIVLQGVRKARIELGESVAVVGLGLIGQMAGQLARINGAAPLIGLDPHEARRRTAMTLGMDLTIDAAAEHAIKLLHGQTDGLGADVVIEATGIPAPVHTALASARKMGRVVLLGSTRGEVSLDLYRHVHKQGLTILGAHEGTTSAHERRPGYWPWIEEARCYERLLASGRIDPTPLITRRIDPSGIDDAYQRLIAGQLDDLAVMIEWKK